MNIFSASLVLFFSSLLVLGANYYHLQISVIQQGIAVLIILLIITLKIFIFSKESPLKNDNLIFSWLVFLTSLLVQLTIFSSGGLYSPLFVMFHLYYLSLSIFVSLFAAIVFLSFAGSALIFNTLNDPRLKDFIVNDPGTAALLILSLIILLPLYHLAASKYHFQDMVSKIIFDKLDLLKSRYNLILGGVADAVLITGKDLHIISINEAGKRLMHLSGKDYLGHYLFEVLSLKNLDGQIIDEHDPQFNQLISAGTEGVLNNLFLYTKDSDFPQRVSVQLQIAKDPKSNVEQIIIIVSRVDVTFGEVKEVGVEELLGRQKKLYQEIKTETKKSGLEDLYSKILLLEKIDKDYYIFSQVKGAAVKLKVDLVDVAQVVQNVLLEGKELPQALGVKLSLSYSGGFTQHFTPEVRDGLSIYPSIETNPNFSALTNKEGLQVLVSNLIKLSILSTLGNNNPTVSVNLSYHEETIEIKMSCIYKGTLDDKIKNILLNHSYNSLIPGGNAKLCSSLEEYLINLFSGLLNLSVHGEINKEDNSLSFNLVLPKFPHHQP